MAVARGASRERPAEPSGVSTAAASFAAAGPAGAPASLWKAPSERGNNNNTNNNYHTIVIIIIITIIIIII